jgi:ArsR family transcriptional regulator, arsenate/arsenite/antimonite-responsive transcriptional repressor / arsenate reductase (thioredoxin)
LTDDANDHDNNDHDHDDHDDHDHVERRAAIHAALGEPARLAVVDRLVTGDASPGQLASDLGMRTNLLAHHLQVLQETGIIRRVRSEGDKRRSYVQLRDDPTVLAAALAGRSPGTHLRARRVLFVCTANSARSPLAAARWEQLSPIPAASAGTHPGPHVHPRAVATGRRHGLDLRRRRPANLTDVLTKDDLIVVVCDNAHEELPAELPRLHWSIPDPVPANNDSAFETTYATIDRRVHRLLDLCAS